MTYALQIDISHECPQSMLDQFENQYNIKFELIEEFGPAGGNPLYQITSNSIDNIKSHMIDEYCDADEFEELYEPYIEQI